MQAVELALGPDAAVRQQQREADEWLCEFQRQYDAWQVCHEILEETEAPLNSRFFASQTLLLKIRNDYTDLQEEIAEAFKKHLITHLLTSMSLQQRGVINLLALAIASIAVQSNWRSFAVDISSVCKAYILLTYSQISH